MKYRYFFITLIAAFVWVWVVTPSKTATTDVTLEPLASDEESPAVVVNLETETTAVVQPENTPFAARSKKAIKTIQEPFRPSDPATLAEINTYGGSLLWGPDYGVEGEGMVIGLWEAR
ncbi:MAG: hypothetical protein LAT76_07590, partial [Schleiferiaceae bacterium]|nr:hypothetical protein [Schleiferiaceae bacterium]